MLAKIVTLGIGSPERVDHPLADPHELRRVIEALAPLTAYKVIDELNGWLDSLRQGNDFAEVELFEVVSQLDEAGQGALLQLTADYFRPARHPGLDDKAIWLAGHTFCASLSQLYERCLSAAQQTEPVNKQIQAILPLLCLRASIALGSLLKWSQLRYAPLPLSVWQPFGKIMLLAEAAGIANKSLAIYRTLPGESSTQREYVKAMALYAASLDGLQPIEMAVAERIIAHVASSFVFSARAESNSVYWVDLRAGTAPQRLAVTPEALSADLRFFKPGTAYSQIDELLRIAERGRALPAEVNLGGLFPAEVLVSSLRYLVDQFSPVPPQRAYVRHDVKHGMRVLRGFAAALSQVSAQAGLASVASQSAEVWQVENVSRTGFGASLLSRSFDSPEVGAMLLLQPGGGDNWLLGVVRRVSRRTHEGISLGVQILGQQLAAITLSARGTAQQPAPEPFVGLLLQSPARPGEVRVIMAKGAFDMSEPLSCVIGNRRCLLRPGAILAQGSDYQLARFQSGALN